MPPEAAYVFKHAVVQDVAYNSLLRERQRELHRRVGYAIEELYVDRLGEHSEELAHHFVNGEEWANLELHRAPVDVRRTPPVCGGATRRTGRGT